MSDKPDQAKPANPPANMAKPVGQADQLAQLKRTKIESVEGMNPQRVVYLPAKQLRALGRSDVVGENVCVAIKVGELLDLCK